MQGKKRLSLSKAFMCCSNIVFLMSGFVLMSLGALLLADSDRVLLSRLLGTSDAHPEQPLFYYVALIIVGVGFIIAITGILGCWASCLYNCCITASYVSVIVLLLLGKCSLCMIVVFWPHLLGVDVRAPRLMKALQRNYALPGREQFTAALDLAQASGCLEMIEGWMQDQALILLAVGLGVVLIELCTLLSTLLACSRLKKQKYRKKKVETSTFTSTQSLSPFNEHDHDYGLNCANMENRLTMAVGSTFGGKS